MASALWYSVYDWNGLIRGEFVGLENFRKVLLDPERNWFFFNALKNNVLVFEGFHKYLVKKKINDN